MPGDDEDDVLIRRESACCCMRRARLSGASPECRARSAQIKVSAGGPGAPGSSLVGLKR